MRNLYYEKSNYQFRKLKKSLNPEQPLHESDLLSELYAFAEILNVCLSYAKSSIYSNKSDKIASYSQDRYWGILQEEILLVYFLEEQISSVKYMISHIETNMKIQSFAKKGNGDIFISHILYNIDELNKSAEKDLHYFYDTIGKRYMIGNKLFGALQELQNFR
jgi:hypothetical protein